MTTDAASPRGVRIRTEIQARQAIQRMIDAAGDVTEGWWVLNSLPVRLTAGNTDIDILVGIPGVGLLVLEFKAWPNFNVNAAGTWTWGPQLQNSCQGPYVQAQREEYLLLELLELYGRRRHWASSPRIGSGVFFGNVVWAEIERAAALDTRFTVTGDLFPGAPSEDEARAVCTRLRSMLSANVEPTRRMLNTRAHLEDIRSALAPTCAVTGLRSMIDDTHDAVNQNSEIMMLGKAEEFTGTRLYVDGAAGTGKTVLALQLAIARAHASKMPALYVCFSERLAEEIRAIKSLQGLNVRIRTPEELLTEVAGQDALRQFQEEELGLAAQRRELGTALGLSDGERLPTRAYLGSDAFWCALVEGAADAGTEFSAVVVDEAQDMWEPAFTSLEQLASPGGLFAIFVDPRQTTRLERALLRWEPPASVSSAERRTLTVNFRNGEQIISGVESACTLVYGRPPRGAPAAELTFIKYSNQAPCASAVKAYLAKLVAEGVDSTVLGTALTSADCAELQLAGITVESVDSFKGLERRSIVLIRGRNLSPLDPNEEELYVGMTRAISHLCVVHHCSDAVLPHLATRK